MSRAEPRQYCQAVSAVLHWSAEDTRPLGARAKWPGARYRAECAHHVVPKIAKLKRLAILNRRMLVAAPTIGAAHRRFIGTCRRIRCTVIRFSPAVVPALLLATWACPGRSLPAQSISTVQNHTCVTDAIGELYCWGAPAWRGGVQAVAYDADPMPPIAHSPSVRFAAVASGLYHDCALIQNGQVVCAGDNNMGQLGRDTSSTCTAAGCGRPDSIMTSERFQSVVSGEWHSCGLTRDGRALCWGSNDAGQTGIGSRAPIVQRPTPVYGQHRFVSLTAGSRHTCGITIGGETLCWGANDKLQLGINNIRRGCQPSAACMAVPAPLDEPHYFVALSAGWDKTCGVSRIGALYCWGFAYSSVFPDKPLALTRIGASMAFSDVRPGYWFTCGLAVGGKAYCWKEQDREIIGQSLIRWGCHDATVCIEEMPVSERLRFRTLTSGQAHVCGIALDGAVYCWGLKRTEKIGQAIAQCEVGKPDPTHECTTEPIQIGGQLKLFTPANVRGTSKP